MLWEDLIVCSQPKASLMCREKSQENYLCWRRTSLTVEYAHFAHVNFLSTQFPWAHLKWSMNKRRSSSVWTSTLKTPLHQTEHSVQITKVHIQSGKAHQEEVTFFHRSNPFAEDRSQFHLLTARLKDSDLQLHYHESGPQARDLNELIYLIAFFCLHYSGYFLHLQPLKGSSVVVGVVKTQFGALCWSAERIPGHASRRWEDSISLVDVCHCQSRMESSRKHHTRAFFWERQMKANNKRILPREPTNHFSKRSAQKWSWTVWQR